jgi:hypothetical protein
MPAQAGIGGTSVVQPFWLYRRDACTTGFFARLLGGSTSLLALNLPTSESNFFQVAEAKFHKINWQLMILF